MNTPQNHSILTMHIWLLTHSEELKKANGTGQLICKHLPDNCTLIAWQRNEPSQVLASLPYESTLVIYPTALSLDKSTALSPSIEAVEHVIILDGTWQQARKMYNRTPYLHNYSTYEITGQVSRYVRRKNQQKSGLCTAETAIYLLQKQGLTDQAGTLESAFKAFNTVI
ncbi:MAG: DTW domain-containing protein [Marinomonas atlantica]|nr:DTW domain-containing protein [Marinomonas atlantica]